MNICQFCEEGETCATPKVACAPDGGCGETTWTCPEDEPAADCDCQVPAICQFCDDDSCAVADVECNPDGSCGEITWTCPDASKRPPPTARRLPHGVAVASSARD